MPLLDVSTSLLTVGKIDENPEIELTGNPETTDQCV